MINCYNDNLFSYKRNMKKSIYFLADSSVDLRFVYDLLKKNYSVTWVYYNKSLKSELLNLEYCENDLILLNKNSLVLLLKKIFNKIFGKIFFFKINFKDEILKNIVLVDKRDKPDLWITDTGKLLAEIKLGSPKATFKHSVTYKKYFLAENIFQYDQVFIPGECHDNRIESYYPNRKNELKTKLLISPSTKIIPYLKLKNNLGYKDIFYEKLNLDKNKKTVVLAPTHNSFFEGRFLPKKFNEETLALEKICKIITEEFNYNFVIKLHHYHFNKLKEKKFIFLKKLANVCVFDSNKNYDGQNSEQVFCIADIVITDTSGVGPLCCFLDKMMIYLDPDEHFDWSSADIEKKLRPGFLMNNINELKNILFSYKNDPTLYKKERFNFNEKIFKYKSLEDLNVIHDQIKNILEKND